MICQCRYFNLVEGKLLCSQCGKEAEPTGKKRVEDKMEAEPENKGLTREQFPPEAKRQRGRPRKR